MRGLFITFEGGEGVGKTTQLRLLAERLCALDLPVRVTREPGAGPLGAKLRDILLYDKITAKAELLLYLADRAQHVADELAPWLAAGQVVLCDRFIDSSEVYQGYARGLGVDFVRLLHRWLLPDLWPDLTLLLDLPPTQGLQRIAGRAGQIDRLENEHLEFHEKLRQGFIIQAQREPQRVRMITTDGAAPDIACTIWQEVEPILRRWRED